MVEATEKPVFIVASERSGTTLLGLMLKHHPELAWVGEFEYATCYLSEDSNWPAFEDYCALLETDRVFLSSKFTVDENLNYPNLLRSFLEQYRQRDSRPWVGATVHKLFHRLPDIWPQAKFIYLLRDGRDVTRSCIHMGWAGNMWTGAHRWLEAERQWAILCKLVEPERRMEVRYENLVTEPVAVLTEICKFIGLKYSPVMMRFDETSTYSKPDPKLAYQWKHSLSKEEIRLCESRIGDQLVRRGYSLSGLSPLKVSPSQEWFLRAQDRLARFHFRLKFYGWKLVVAELITRRLCLKRFNKPLKLKMNSIVTVHLK